MELRVEKVESEAETEERRKEIRRETGVERSRDENGDGWCLIKNLQTLVLRVHSDRGGALSQISRLGRACPCALSLQFRFQRSDTK